jgi:hypothetical protein
VRLLRVSTLLGGIMAVLGLAILLIVLLPLLLALALTGAALWALISLLREQSDAGSELPRCLKASGVTEALHEGVGSRKLDRQRPAVAGTERG